MRWFWSRSSASSTNLNERCFLLLSPYIPFMLAWRSRAPHAVPSGPLTARSVAVRKPRHHLQRCECSSAVTADLSNRLSQSEQSKDWAAALEVVTEAKVLKVDLPADAYECAVRIFADSETQWKRAADLFEGMIDKGMRPSDATARALFQALVASGQGTRALLLLQKLEVNVDSNQPSQPLSPLYNMTVRAHVKQGEIEQAFVLLERIVQSDGRLEAEAGTFSAVAGAFLRNGDDARAEEVLDMRDYL